MYGAGGVRPNGLSLDACAHYAMVNSANGALNSTTTVLVAVESPKVREALVAMLGAHDGFQVVAEADSEDTAIEAARIQRPQLALIDLELSGCGGWWAIHQIQAEHLAGVVVALGRRGDSGCVQMSAAQTYVQMGASPSDLVSALEAAVLLQVSDASGQTERDLLTDTHTVF
jgi:DNA-binding NarL/FixJ family response regulator